MQTTIHYDAEFVLNSFRHIEQSCITGDLYIVVWMEQRRHTSPRVPPVIGRWGHHHHRLFSAVREHKKGFKPTHGYWQRQTFNYGPKSSQFLNAYHQNIKRLWLAVCSVPRKTLADIRRKFCHALKWRLSFTVNTKICYVNCEKNALNFEW